MADTATGTAAFDPFEPGFDAWPYDQYTRLRDQDPVHWSAMLCGWVLTRFDDVTRVLRDPTISSDFDNATPSPVVDLIRARPPAATHPGPVHGPQRRAPAGVTGRSGR